MIVLDTDHVNVLQIGKGRQYDCLVSNMAKSSDDVVTTVISYEEQMRGWMAEVNRVRDAGRQVRIYDRFINLIRFFQAWEVLRFSDAEALRFKDLRRMYPRIGAMDLKIASIALEHDATVATANGRDFEQIMGLRVEDWIH